MTRTLKAVMKKMVRKNPKSMCLQKWLQFLMVSFFIFTDFFLVSLLSFFYSRKIVFGGLVWAQKKDFSSLFNFFNYFDTQKKQTGYGYIWFCKIIFGANGSMNEGSNKGKSNTCSL